MSDEKESYEIKQKMYLYQKGEVEIMWREIWEKKNQEMSDEMIQLEWEEQLQKKECELQQWNCEYEKQTH